jgi:hypothetical protein
MRGVGPDAAVGGQSVGLGGARLGGSRDGGGVARRQVAGVSQTRETLVVGKPAVAVGVAGVVDSGRGAGRPGEVTGGRGSDVSQAGEMSQAGQP